MKQEYIITMKIESNGRLNLHVLKGEWTWHIGQTWDKFLDWLGQVEPNIRFHVDYLKDKEESEEE